ncbi:TIP41-like protein [Exaiptasia diaphana]|uniref:TIP41-like protein n=1 Tax=Exaiptasia diaphana TaxID=2652724 RepID=A0A913XUS0_EXADI|nr:TIP41-like protein [Exaiptasia diaphana]
MTFGDNSLEIKHEAGFGIQFNGIDALRLVDNKHDLMKVAVADAWQRERQDSEFIHEVIKPFDWTFTTDYKGTLVETNENSFKVSPSTQRIDMEKLKIKEKIYFYDDIVLYEDELADNGIAKLNVKMRVMQSSLFLLLRFFLRVDGVLVRINDTRLYHQAGSNFFLREYSSREKPVSQITGVLTDPNSLSDQLDIVKETVEVLEFQSGTDAKES